MPHRYPQKIFSPQMHFFHIHSSLPTKTKNGRCQPPAIRQSWQDEKGAGIKKDTRESEGGSGGWWEKKCGYLF